MDRRGNPTSREGDLSSSGRHDRFSNLNSALPLFQGRSPTLDIAAFRRLHGFPLSPQLSTTRQLNLPLGVQRNPLLFQNRLPSLSLVNSALLLRPPPLPVSTVTRPRTQFPAEMQASLRGFYAARERLTEEAAERDEQLAQKFRNVSDALNEHEHDPCPREEEGPEDQKRMLPEAYVPSQRDVLCGRGKAFREWPGNAHFRALVDDRLDAYRIAEGRSEKGAIIREIVQQVRAQPGAVGFVKQDEKGRFYEVGDFLAREKTSQQFRDSLQELYSSSTFTRKRRRHEETMKLELERLEKVKELELKQRQLLVLRQQREREQVILRNAMAAIPISDQLALAASKQRLNTIAASLPARQPATKKTRTEVDCRTDEEDVANVLQQLPSILKSVKDAPSAELDRDLSQSSAHSKPAASAASSAASTPVASPRKKVASSTVPHVTTSPRPPVSPPELVICAVQTTMRQARESPLDAATRILGRIEKIAASKKADIFVLPELCPVGLNEDTITRYLPNTQLLKDMFGLIDEVFAMWATRLHVFMCYGTIGWKVKEDGSEGFTIRQKVVDDTGVVVAVYDKIHLSDFGDSNETRYFEPGSGKLASFTIDNFCLGLMLSADMRNPNLARTLARDHRVDVLLQPAAFARDSSFRTWKSFRETRAVENSCYFVGVNYSGYQYGETSIVPPWVDEDDEPEELGTQDGFLIGRIKRSVLDLVRSTLPYHRQLWSVSKHSERKSLEL